MFTIIECIGYYLAAYWDEKGVKEKVLEYALLSHHFAQQTGSNLFNAKAKHWIGSAYYDLDMWENAGIYCLKALVLYDKESNVDIYKFDLMVCEKIL